MQHLARAVETDVVRNDKAGDHGLAKTQARFDDSLISPGDRVLGKHDPGDGGFEERLDDDADAGAGEQADAAEGSKTSVEPMEPTEAVDAADPAEGPEAPLDAGEPIQTDEPEAPLIDLAELELDDDHLSS